MKPIFISCLCTILILSAPHWSRPDEGYLFVSSRADEVVFAANRLRKVSPHANITFVADGATLKDAARHAAIFDLMLTSEKMMPDITMHDSMGFRLQKLRGMTLSPYARTIYMDSDTYICHSIDDLFSILETVDMAMTWGGRGNHSGASAGVLAYSATQSAMAVWKAWEQIYRGILHKSRREQPAFQQALARVKESIGIRVRKLPMTYNCRNIRQCEVLTKLKDGTTGTCKVLHAHAFDVEESTESLTLDAESAGPKYADKCPVMGGTHRIVFFFQPTFYDERMVPNINRKQQITQARMSTSWRLHDEASVFFKALTSLKVDNDFSICDLSSVQDEETASNMLQRCIEKSNKYAVIVFASFSPNKEGVLTNIFSNANSHIARQQAPLFVALIKHPLQRCAENSRRFDLSELSKCISASVDHESHAPSCFQKILGCQDNANAVWFCGATSECRTSLESKPRVVLNMAKTVIDQQFLAIGLDTRRLFSSAEFERVLPSHFLRLTSHLSEEHTHQERINFLTPTLRQAFSQVNALDYELYDYIAAHLKERRLCHNTSVLRNLHRQSYSSTPTPLSRSSRGHKHVILPTPP